MVEYGTSFEPLTNREESWAQDSDFTHAGDSYIVRITALYPYKTYKGPNGDALRAHIDFINVTQGTSGRFADVQIDPRNPNEASGHLRRHSTYRTLRRLLQTRTPTVSPVFPQGT